MHKDELANWHKIKEHFEKIGKTSNQYYIRAVAICAGNDDPLVLPSKIESETE